MTRLHDQKRAEVCQWLGNILVCVVVLIVYDMLKPPLLALLGYGERYHELE